MIRDRFIPFGESGSLATSTRLYRVTRAGEIISEVDADAYGSIAITCNENVPVKRSAQIAVYDASAFRPFLDFVMPVLIFIDPEGNTISNPQGVYMVVPSTSTVGPVDSTAVIECHDLSQLLLMATKSDAICPKDTDRGEFSRQIISEMGFAPNQVDIPDYGILQLDEDRVWDPGTSIYQILTDMANGSNWYQPWFNNHGTLITRPFLPLTEIAPSDVFSNRTDYDSMNIERNISDQPDWNRLSNVVTVRKIGDEDNPTISYTARNVNPDSPSSIPSLGMEVNPKLIDNHDLTSQDEAQRQAEALLSESSSYYRKISLATFPPLDADLHQTIDLEIVRGDTIILAGTFWRTGYTLTLDGAHVDFVQDLARVEPWT